jgi:predicted N-formylglutamate amidohydrolase
MCYFWINDLDKSKQAICKVPKQWERAVVAGNQELSLGGMVNTLDENHHRPLHRRCATPG